MSNLDKSTAPYEASFLVYMGAIDCMASGTVLQNAGIAPAGRTFMNSRTANLSRIDISEQDPDGTAERAGGGRAIAVSLRWY